MFLCMWILLASPIWSDACGDVCARTKEGASFEYTKAWLENSLGKDIEGCSPLTH